MYLCKCEDVIVQNKYLCIYEDSFESKKRYLEITTYILRILLFGKSPIDTNLRNSLNPSSLLFDTFLV